MFVGDDQEMDPVVVQLESESGEQELNLQKLNLFHVENDQLTVKDFPIE